MEKGVKCMKQEKRKWYIIFIVGLVISELLKGTGIFEIQLINIVIGLILSVPIGVLLYKSSKDEGVSERKRYIAKLSFYIFVFVLVVSCVLELMI